MEKTLDFRILKTYNALHEAFVELLETKSFEEMTVNELCDRARIRRATFYKHFEDKYDYFHFFLSELHEELKENITAKNSVTNANDYTIQLLHETFQFAHKHKAIWNRIKNSNRMSFLYQALEKQISLELYNIMINIHKNQPSQELDLLISFYAGGLINVIYQWLEQPNPLTEQELVEKLFKIAPLPTN